MSLATFNMHHAHPEAIVRGLRGGFLTQTDYNHLSQCETVDGRFLNCKF